MPSHSSIEKKEAGQIKKVGFSFHDTADVLDQILTAHPEMDFVQLQINYLDWEDANIQSRLCYEVALKHQKEIIVMELIKGEILAQVPETAVKMIQNQNLILCTNCQYCVEGCPQHLPIINYLKEVAKTFEN